ncbi:MAG: hypothetical protein ACRC4M_03350, partial [Mycoplasma sp.]
MKIDLSIFYKIIQNKELEKIIEDFIFNNPVKIKNIIHLYKTNPQQIEELTDFEKLIAVGIFIPEFLIFTKSKSIPEEYFWETCKEIKFWIEAIYKWKGYWGLTEFFLFHSIIR